MTLRRNSLCFALAGLVTMAGSIRAVEHLVPFYQYTQTLVAAEDMDGGRYLAFPITVRLDENEILVGYKRGYSHAFDREADFDLLRLNPGTERIRRLLPPLHRDQLNLQNGEFVRFGNGDIACYIDVQQPGREAGSNEATRLGLIEFRSKDNGSTFSDVGRIGLVDGVEYGYAFDSITEGPTTWMLAMTFANLPGGRSISPTRPKAGHVAVLRSDDYGKNWRRVKDLTETFKSPLNESAFMRYQDGFLFVCRPYANEQPVVVTDAEFTVRRRVDLVAKYDFIAQGMGRPRVFTRDGRVYILARNTFKDTATLIAPRPVTSAGQVVNRAKLGLFRLNPETLVIEKHVILDNAENQRVASAYYATPYWATKKGHTYFNVVTYKQITGRMPDIVRFEYDWDEVK